MTIHADDTIARRVEESLRAAGVELDPQTHGPVPLQQLFLEHGLRHVALPRLTRAAVKEHLLGMGVETGQLGDPETTLQGFLFTAGGRGIAYVNTDDILPRRRFTAAHELGHFVLHQTQMSSGFVSDTKESILEAVEGLELQLMEREANHFAVELLMPAQVCRIRADQLRHDQGCCPRIALAYRLAAELLVSREAMRYRLQALELGDD